MLADWVDDVASALRLRRAPLLPLSSSDRPRSHIRSSLSRVTLPSRPSVAHVITYSWLGLSLLVAMLGYAACVSSSTRASLVCTDTTCTFERHRGQHARAAAALAAAHHHDYHHGSNRNQQHSVLKRAAAGLPPQAAVERAVFPREHLLGAAPTRTRNGEAVDFEEARVQRRRRQKVLGHSYLVRFKRRAGSSKADGQGAEKEYDYGSSSTVVMEEASVLFARHNIGRKRARRQAAAINQYARGEVDFLDVVEYKKWSALGVLLVVLGLVSAAFAMLLGPLSGAWDEEDGESEKMR